VSANFFQIHHSRLDVALVDRPSIALLLAVLSGLWTGSLAAQEKTEPMKKDAKDELKLTKDEEPLIELTNAERKKAELPPLTANAKLMAAARGHAANMAKQEKLDHTLDEKEPPDRVKDAGYKYRATGENIAWNARGPKEVVGVWMDSEVHKANILHETFTEIGVAVAAARTVRRRDEPFVVTRPGPVGAFASHDDLVRSRDARCGWIVKRTGGSTRPFDRYVPDLGPAR
jgi:hypothetical protein